MSFNEFLSRQFSKPSGFGGSVVSYVMNRQNRPLYDELVRILPVSAGDRVLDVGCGNGFVMGLLAGRHDAQFTGIDISADIIASADKRWRKLVEAGTMSFSTQDVGSMSFADGSFEVAYTINTVYFWDDLDSALGEIGRVLAPGGVFYNVLYTNEMLGRRSFTNTGYKKFKPEELLDAGRRVGFTADIESLLGGQAYCVKYEKHQKTTARTAGCCLATLFSSVYWIACRSCR
jgi:ubiquinone/menaquinone biosynthesis C-methylase UbiE